MSQELEAYMSKGLTEDEARALESYELRGRPGITKLKADNFKDMYVQGYSCQDLAKQFPEYELGILLWARVHFKWDIERQAYQHNLAKQSASALGLSKAEAIRFLSDVLNATHVKNRAEIMKYLAAPDREKPPEFLPKTLSGYSTLLSMLQDMMQSLVPKGAGDVSNAAANPLVSVTVNQGSSDKPTIEIKQQQDAKSALLEKVGKKK